MLYNPYLFLYTIYYINFAYSELVEGKNRTERTVVSRVCDFFLFVLLYRESLLNSYKSTNKKKSQTRESTVLYGYWKGWLWVISIGIGIIVQYEYMNNLYSFLSLNIPYQ